LYIFCALLDSLHHESHEIKMGEVLYRVFFNFSYSSVLGLLAMFQTETC